MIKFYGMKNNLVEYHEIEVSYYNSEGYEKVLQLKENSDKSYYVDGYTHYVYDKAKNIDCRLIEEHEEHEAIYNEIMAIYSGYSIYDELEGFKNEFELAFDNR
jgi:hypothetical protein